jgi:hypothetical protein
VRGDVVDLGPGAEGRPPPQSSGPVAPQSGSAWVGVRRWVLQWVRTHGRSLAIMAVLLVVIGVVYRAGMANYPSRVDDEGTYVARAWALEHWHVLDHYTYAYDHPPLGWMLIAVWTWATGAWSRVDFAVTAGREVMVLAHLVSCGLMYILARRLGIRRNLSVAAVVLFSFSPVALDYHRQVYLDNLATPFLLAAFLLALSPHRRLTAHAGSAICFAAAVLTKETSLLLLPCLGYQLWRNTDRRTREFSLALFSVLLVVVAAVYPLYALLKGELFPGSGHVSLVDGIRFQLSRAGSGEVLNSQSIAHRLVAGWLHRDIWLLVGGAVATVVLLPVARYRPLALGSLTLWLLLLRPGYLPIPYVIGLVLFAPLMIAGVAEELWRLGVTPAGAHWRRVRGWGTHAMTALAILLVGLTAFVVGPGWLRSDAQATTTNPEAHLNAAEQWILMNLPKDKRVLVTDTLWIDMVRAGWSPQRVIWFYKIDSDPAVQRQYPRGWKDFDYIVSTDEIRASVTSDTTLRQVKAALANSSPVKVFGVGGNDVEVRKINSP